MFDGFILIFIIILIIILFYNNFVMYDRKLPIDKIANFKNLFKNKTLIVI